MFLRIISALGYLLARCFSIKSYIAFVMLTCGYHAAFAQTANKKHTAGISNGYLKAKFDVKLSNKVRETSGLIWWNNQVWTHNDSGGDPVLYAIDTATGKVVQKVTVTNATNVDWEDIAQDEEYIYIGDFGNNRGNRKDLKIYKVRKSDVLKNAAVKADIIHFSYSDQTDFTPVRGENTNFDCEAFIAYGDSLFLFSKDWIDGETRLYKLSKQPGTYTAVNIDKLNVHGLITGATVIPGKRVIVLTGYNPLLKPFVYLLYDFSGDQFFAASKKKIGINQSFLQVEGVCPLTDTQFYISNEKMEKLFKKSAKLQTINLASLLNPYYATLPSKTASIVKHSKAHSFKDNSAFATK